MSPTLSRLIGNLIDSELDCEQKPKMSIAGRICPNNKQMLNQHSDGRKNCI